MDRDYYKTIRDAVHDESEEAVKAIEQTAKTEHRDMTTPIALLYIGRMIGAAATAIAGLADEVAATRRANR